MKLLKFSELGEYPRALIIVYAIMMVLCFTGGLLVVWLVNVNVGFPIIVASLLFAVFIVFVYLVDCYMYIE